ncbi:MAG: hypothetical protein HQK77_04345 [Desulfobacterales bacterium]|nr:hypothetical protein [Desulfobacterales bacterium]
MRYLKIHNISFWIVICIMYAFFNIKLGYSEDWPYEKIIGTHYTGNVWAPAFWSQVNIHDVQKDLLEIKSNDFNSIILVVPWVGFQSSVKPIAYFEPYFSILDSICRIAQDQGFNIILRLGYAHDIAVNSSPVHAERIQLLFSDDHIKQAWFHYLNRIHDVVAHYKRFRFAFISWEDFFYHHLLDTTLENRKALAKSTGYQGYLQKYPLIELSKLYQTPLSSYEDIPIPERSLPAVKLFHEFCDDFLLTFFAKSMDSFKELAMEVRVDCEKGSEPDSYLCHEKTFDLGGKGDITIIYYAPAWGAKNNGDFSNAKDTLNRFEYLMNRIRSNTQNFIFIDQFNFVDNTPCFEQNTKIIPNQIPEFINQAASVIKDQTIGYSLWTMKDVRGNVMKNGFFERETLGWTLENAEIKIDPQTQNRYVSLKDTGKLTQTIDAGLIVNQVLSCPQQRKQFNFACQIKRLEPKPSEIAILIQDLKGSIIYKTQIPVTKDEVQLHQNDLPLFTQATLTIQNKGATVSIDNLELYFNAQENGIYDIQGNPKPFYQSIVSLNKTLAATMSALSFYDKEHIRQAVKGLYDDGWAATSLTGKIQIPASKTSFVVNLYVPESWNNYKNQISVKIDKNIYGKFPIGPGQNTIRFSLDMQVDSPQMASFELIADQTFLASAFDPQSQDQRQLSYILISFGFEG